MRTPRSSAPSGNVIVCRPPCVLRSVRSSAGVPAAPARLHLDAGAIDRQRAPADAARSPHGERQRLPRPRSPAPQRRGIVLGHRDRRNAVGLDVPDRLDLELPRLHPRDGLGRTQRDRVARRERRGPGELGLVGRQSDARLAVLAPESPRSRAPLPRGAARRARLPARAPRAARRASRSAMRRRARACVRPARRRAAARRRARAQRRSPRPASHRAAT